MDCMSLLAANVVQVFVFGGGDVYVLLECAVVMCTCLWMPMDAYGWHPDTQHVLLVRRHPKARSDEVRLRNRYMT
jgi:hypothetical protein